MDKTGIISVMIAEDNHYARNFFSSVLEKEKDSRIKITGKAANGLELLKLIEKELPDLVILDLAMPVLDGYKTLIILQDRFPELKVVIFSGFCSDYFIGRMLIAGARAYMVKGTYPDKMVAILHLVNEEGYYMEEPLRKALVTCLVEDKEIHRILEENILSDREIEILKLICNDKEAKEISDLLCISESAVKYHKKNLKEKTKTLSTAGLVKYALRTGLLQI